MPGLILFLGASRVSFQPGIDPFGLQPNRTPAAHARVPELLAPGGWMVSRLKPAYAPAPATFNQGFIATLPTRHRVTQPLSNRFECGCALAR